MNRKLGLLLAGAVIAGGVGAQTRDGIPRLEDMALTPATRCVVAAAKRHSVNPWVLKAILKVESNFNPGAINRNPNGTKDIGMAQINTIHLRELSKHGISGADLLDPCVSTYVAAWHLAKQYRQYGNTWFAVGAYHSVTRCYNERYVGLVWNALVEWKVMDAPRRRTQSLEACGFKAVTAEGTSKKPTGSRVAKANSAGLMAFDE